MRRIEALTSQRAYGVTVAREEELRRVGDLVRGKPGEIERKVESLVQRQRQLETELERLKDKMAYAGSGDLVSQAVEVDGVKVLAARIEGADNKTLRNLLDTIKAKLGSGAVVLGSVEGDKVLLVAGVTADLTGRLNAGKIIGVVAPVVGGSGGGRPDMAQAGGKDPARLDEALAGVAETVRGML